MGVIVKSCTEREKDFRKRLFIICIAVGLLWVLSYMFTYKINSENTLKEKEFTVDCKIKQDAYIIFRYDDRDTLVKGVYFGKVLEIWSDYLVLLLGRVNCNNPAVYELYQKKQRFYYKSMTEVTNLEAQKFGAH